MAEVRDLGGSGGAGDDSYSVAETAALLGVTESAVRKRLDRGVLVAIPTTGGRLRIDAASVAAERRRLLERVDAQGLADRERLQSEVTQLTEALGHARAERERLHAAMESLLQAHAALRDTVAQLLSEQRVVD